MMTPEIFWLGLRMKINNLFQPMLNRRQVPGRWFTPGKFKNYNASENRFTAEYENGILVISGITGSIMKVEFLRSEENSLGRFMVEDAPVCRIKVISHDSEIIIRPEEGHLSLRLDPENCLLKAFYEDVLLHADAAPVSFNKQWVQSRKRGAAEERILGFGQKTGGIYKNNSRLIMWNTDNSNVDFKADPIYQSCPYQIFLREEGLAHGLFYDNPHYAEFYNKKSVHSYSSERGPLSYYILGGPDLKEVVSQYTLLTGKYPFPPRWVLGHHHSRWVEKESAEGLLELAANFREQNIPCDVLHIDIGHMEGYRCFTWHPERFPDPAGVIKELKARSFKSVVIVDPGMKKDPHWDLYQEGVEKDHFCKRPNGKTYHGPVWPGNSAFPEFTHPESVKWWGNLYKRYTDIGIDGFWNDMNEPSIFTPLHTMPYSLVHRGESENYDHRSIHNVYGMLMARASALAIRQLRPDKRYFLFSRSSSAGIQRFASTWTGDNTSNWTHLKMSIPMVLNMGLSGQVMTGPDMGGFWGRPSKELMLRWIALGAFYPFCRNHTSLLTPPQEFWSLGQEVLDTARKFLKLRYRLLPYLYTKLKESCETGLPLMRPLFMEYPEDRNCYKPENAESQFFIGEDLMVAPVLEAGSHSRSVYFPEGADWINWWTLEKIPGGSQITVEVPFDTVPLYARSGAIIPVGREACVTEEVASGPLELLVFPGKQLQGAVYLDDGESLDFQNGQFTRISVSGGDSSEKLWLALVKESGGSSGKMLFQHSHVSIKIAVGARSIRNVLIDKKSTENLSPEGNWLSIPLEKLFLPMRLELLY